MENTKQNEKNGNRTGFIVNIITNSQLLIFHKDMDNKLPLRFGPNYTLRLKNCIIMSAIG